MAIAVHVFQFTPTFNPKRARPSFSVTPSRIVTMASFSWSGRELIELGTVRPVRPKDAFSAMKEEGFVLLDVRPVWEREKASVPGSLHVPLFVEDSDGSPITFLKKWVHLGYIGLWTGQLLTTINNGFLKEVEEIVPDKNAKLLVACGEGLRSMMAVKRLHEGGYQNLGWLAGGFNRAEEDDFQGVEGTTKLQYATIGGASYYFLQVLLLLQAVGNKT
ncbi:rhodanese-like domain-containing protein 10 [Tasmannia lanceolata]|uniref:rhodanese-like domain-containing protein 10 n=1 Tax=Tasmannia lanceolata TaxID=3420 RepID=UPI0040635E21